MEGLDLEKPAPASIATGPWPRRFSLPFGGLLLGLVGVLATGCTSNRPPELDPFTVLPGQWGWSKTTECPESPQRLSFSEDRKSMYLSVTIPNDDGTHGPRKNNHYRVLGQAGNRLSVALDNDQARDDAGNPVTWDAVLLSRDEYCWNRSDWKDTQCTSVVRRCKP